MNKPLLLLSICMPLSGMQHSPKSPKLTAVQRLIINQQQVLKGKPVDMTRVYAYPIKHVVNKFRVDYEVSVEEADQAEFALKTFLINAALDFNQGSKIYDRKVSHLWHTFILHTQDYHRFCFTCFGKFIHHYPASHDCTKIADSSREEYQDDVPNAQTLQSWYELTD